MVWAVIILESHVFSHHMESCAGCHHMVLAVIAWFWKAEFSLAVITWFESWGSGTTIIRAVTMKQNLSNIGEYHPK